MSLAPENVVSDEDVQSDAMGRATAVLDGQRLLIGGAVTDLGSPLRDIAEYEDTEAEFRVPEEDEEAEEDEDEAEAEGEEENEEAEEANEDDEDEPDQEDVVEDFLDPGIHIHEGGPDETTGYIYPLVAHIDDFGETSMRYAGSFLLSDSQIATLHNEELYQDVPTDEFEDCEVRDQLTPTNTDVQLFDAELTGDTTVVGQTTAFLTDGELVVGGGFSGLRSRLANQTENILAPGISIVGPGEDGSQFELIADIDDDQGSGAFAGSYELTEDTRERLTAGEFTIEIATEDHPDGAAGGKLAPR